jgi:hypothetical protein
VTNEGLELRFRKRNARQVPWRDVVKVETPTSDPTTFIGRRLSLSKLHVQGEKRPFMLVLDAGTTILTAYREQVGEYAWMKDEPAGWKHVGR